MLLNQSPVTTPAFGRKQCEQKAFNKFDALEILRMLSPMRKLPRMEQIQKPPCSFRHDSPPTPGYLTLDEEPSRLRQSRNQNLLSTTAASQFTVSSTAFSDQLLRQQLRDEFKWLHKQLRTIGSTSDPPLQIIEHNKRQRRLPSNYQKVRQKRRKSMLISERKMFREDFQNQCIKK